MICDMKEIKGTNKVTGANTIESLMCIDYTRRSWQLFAKIEATGMYTIANIHRSYTATKKIDYFEYVCLLFARAGLSRIVFAQQWEVETGLVGVMYSYTAFGRKE